MRKKFEITMIIPEDSELIGVRTEKDTVIVVFEIKEVRQKIGFAPPMDNDNDNDNDNDAV